MLSGLELQLFVVVRVGGGNCGEGIGAVVVAVVVVVQGRVAVVRLVVSKTSTTLFSRRRYLFLTLYCCALTARIPIQVSPTPSKFGTLLRMIVKSFTKSLSWYHTRVIATIPCYIAYQLMNSLKRTRSACNQPISTFMQYISMRVHVEGGKG